MSATNLGKSSAILTVREYQVVFRSIAVGALIFLFAAIDSSWADKPSPPIPPLPGRIYYDWNSELRSMRPDGTDKRLEFPAPLGSSLRRPSYNTFGSDNHRWWLTYKNVGDLTVRRELVAVAMIHGQLVECQLTNVGFDVTRDQYVRLNDEILASPEWSNDGLDSFVSLNGKRYLWDAVAGEYVANRSELYWLRVSAAEIDFLATQGQDLLAGIESLQTVLTAQEISPREFSPHHWSPDASRVVYVSQFGGVTSALVTVLSSQETVRLDDTMPVTRKGGVEFFRYSPNPLVDRIIGDWGNEIWTVNPDGTNPYQLPLIGRYGFYTNGPI